NYGVRVKAGKTVYVDELHLQVGVGTSQTMYVLNSNTGVTGLNVQGLINGTLSGVATYVKAGTISDADFTSPVNGLIGWDSTNDRLYIRNDGAWNYIAKTAGFQIPNFESAGLSVGDTLLPYVESIMSDGAVHGLYKKLDLASLLATPKALAFNGEVTFNGRVTFADPDMQGQITIPVATDQVTVTFPTPFSAPPILTYQLQTATTTDSASLQEGRQVTATNLSSTGFTLLLDAPAPTDFTYSWLALDAPHAKTTTSESDLSRLLGATATESATPPL
ncbi:MAG: H-type lectin domain-containing protein, partial [bacterium]